MIVQNAQQAASELPTQRIQSRAFTPADINTVRTPLRPNSRSLKRRPITPAGNVNGVPSAFGRSSSQGIGV